jgi:predicted metal-dependent peptidase
LDKYFRNVFSEFADNNCSPLGKRWFGIPHIGLPLNTREEKKEMISEKYVYVRETETENENENEKEKEKENDLKSKSSRHRESSLQRYGIRSRRLFRK